MATSSKSKKFFLYAAIVILILIIGGVVLEYFLANRSIVQQTPPLTGGLNPTAEEADRFAQEQQKEHDQMIAALRQEESTSLNARVEAIKPDEKQLIVTPYWTIAELNDDYSFQITVFYDRGTVFSQWFRQGDQFSMEKEVSSEKCIADLRVGDVVFIYADGETQNRDEIKAVKIEKRQLTSVVSSNLTMTPKRFSVEQPKMTP